ncbi:MAG: NusG domain II-containing protein [Nitrospiraceae bacterium]|nr:MAG: NusG domain II-containing protein [Nitrospiraceae bacterium]
MKKVFKNLSLSYIVTSLTFADKLLFLFLLVSALSGLIFVKKLFPSGEIVKIGLDNKTVYTLPLDEDKTVSVTGPLGDSIIELKDKRVHMKKSPCPDQLCVKQGWTDRGAIICLPNKVIISVGKGDKNIVYPGYDAVTR